MRFGVVKSDVVLSEIQSRIQSGYPLIFLQSAEEVRWERHLSELALEIEHGLVTWTVTQGTEPPASSTNDHLDHSAIGFLHQIEEYPESHLFLAKDFSVHLNDPLLIRRLRDLIPVLVAQQKTIIVLEPNVSIPTELAKDAVKIELPLPGYEDLLSALDETLESQSTGLAKDITLSVDDKGRLINAVTGLTINEACKAWKRALLGRSSLDDDALEMLVAEKRSLASGSDFLDFYDLDEKVDDIGGLDQLKDWLQRRSEAYSPRAREQAVPLPKGVLLLGVQGCGKSLTARATARLLSFPLIRLDIAALLGAQRGESERNMRSVLDLIESIAPVVLWMDEIEKGFAGIEMDGPVTADATMLRLVGTFLTWMADLEVPVFIIATANSVENLPPELLRRGRFDELFFVDLPNFDERRTILQIHLEKRGWKSSQFDLDDIARRSEGFSGAELEQIIVTALINAFGYHRVLTQDDLEQSWRSTVPLSVTMEDKIFALRNWAQDRCRRATSDSRVTSMIEAEQRIDARHVLRTDSADFNMEPWMQLASAGQAKAAIVEFVRSRGDVLIPELVDAMADHLEVEGDQGLAIRSNPNMVLWAGLSQSICELICELVSSKRLYVHPTDFERYKALHKGLRLPVLKEPNDERIARASWLPTSIRTAPHPVHSARMSRIGRIRLNSTQNTSN